MLAPLRFLLVAPAALIALSLFAIYFGARNNVSNPVLKWAIMIPFAIPTALANVTWNLVFASFVYLEWPPLRNEDGELSPLFTTRINKRRREGDNSPTTLWYVWAVNYFDPGHFD